jgi:hypothetical protein
MVKVSGSGIAAAETAGVELVGGMIDPGAAVDVGYVVEVELEETVDEDRGAGLGVEVVDGTICSACGVELVLVEGSVIFSSARLKPGQCSRANCAGSSERSQIRYWIVGFAAGSVLLSA